jgi:hypothetical protein
MPPARTDTGSDAEASSSYIDLRRYLQRDEASNGHRDRFDSRET